MRIPKVQDDLQTYDPQLHFNPEKIIPDIIFVSHSCIITPFPLSSASNFFEYHYGLNLN